MMSTLGGAECAVTRFLKGAPKSSARGALVTFSRLAPVDRKGWFAALAAFKIIAREHSRVRLTGEIFEALLLQLDTDRVGAGERYEVLRHKLIRFFEWNHHLSAPDLADETITRLATKCRQHPIANVETYALGIARNVGREAAKVESRTKLLADNAAPDAMVGPDQEDGLRAAETRRLEERAKRCVDALDMVDQEIFVGFFLVGDNHAEHRRELAKSLGISYGALRTRVCRLRARVHECMTRQSGSYPRTS